MASIRLSVSVLLLFSTALVRAQTPEPELCQELLEEGEAHYRAGEFEEALDSVQRTLRISCDSPATRAGIQRLATLTFLRTGDEERAAFHARVIFLEDPGYEPDPVLDPPDYVAFVLEHRPPDLPPPVEHPVVDDTPIAEEVPEEPQIIERRATVYAEVGLGANVYDGERGQWADSIWDDIRYNSGALGMGEISIEVHPRIHAGLRLSLYHIPNRFFLDFAPPEPLDRDRSSSLSWGVQITGGYDVLVTRYALLAPTLAMGTIISYLNDAPRIGVLVQPGVRLAVPVYEEWEVVVRGELGIVTPGTALDLRDFSNRRDGERGFDLLSTLTIGTRYRLPW